MSRSLLWAGIVVCPCAVGVAMLAAQGPAAPVRQTAYLKASNPGMFDHFGEGGALDGHTGQAVALSRDGRTIAVGAQHESSGARGVNGNQTDESAYNAGAVYVYTRAGAGWAQQAYVKASNAGAGDHFGSTVALSADGSTMAVAAVWESSAATGVNGNQDDNSLPQAGAVYVFTRRGASWSQQAYLKASNTGRRGAADDTDGDQFGFSLALSGDGSTLAVGATSEDSNAAGINGNQADDSASSAGAVYLFTRTGATWTQQAYVKSDAPPMAAAGDQFGYSLALDATGATLAVGVYDEGGSARTVNGPIDAMRNGSGAVYVFTRTGRTWTRQGYLKTWNSEGGDSWGVSVALSDDGATLATGSLDEDCLCPGAHTDSGVGIADQKSDTSAGAVAIFARAGSTWAQQAYIKASNIGSFDWFGVRLALSGDGGTLAVGAQNEDSAAQGVNGRQDDDSAEEAGAVYLFRRTGAAWTQQAYVKGALTEAYDEFGGAVALDRDGGLLVVGARGEDSGAAGVNGNQADNAVDESGAVYVFTR
ncbi:MAG: integrin [Acidobacteria bacterium]|nr:integrin [Acidobacteriota bacterium]